jgi:hypothetical protein
MKHLPKLTTIFKAAMIGIATTGALLSGSTVTAAPAAADQKIASPDGQREEMTRQFGGSFLNRYFWVKYAKSGNQCETTTYFDPKPDDAEAMHYLPTVNPNGSINVLPGGQNTNVCPPW